MSVPKLIFLVFVVLTLAWAVNPKLLYNTLWSAVCSENSTDPDCAPERKDTNPKWYNANGKFDTR